MHRDRQADDEAEAYYGRGHPGQDATQTVRFHDLAPYPAGAILKEGSVRMATEDLVVFRQAIAELRDMPKEIRKETRPALRRAAEPIAGAARGNASWSGRIPGAIRVVVLKRGVEIRVNRKKAPHARPYEGLASGLTFRHPVFGEDRWVAQRARPFLLPAVRAHRDEVRRAVAEVVERVARHHGFH